VVEYQMTATVGVAGTEGAQEVTKLQISMPLVALREDLPCADIKGGKEVDRAMADILKLRAFNQARTQGQGWVQALQGLDVGLLVETEHTTVTRRMQIEVENFGHLLLKQGVGPGQEITQAMRFEHQRRQ